MGQKSSKIRWEEAPDIKRRLLRLIRQAEVSWIKNSRVFTYRSFGSKSRAHARTWGLPRLWQEALKIKPAYIIEVVSEHFDKLTEIDRDKILLHEIMHIPKNFSGALTPHIKRGKRNFHRRVNDLIGIYLRNK